MKITVLGCGGAGGVPLIGNNWGHCNPQNPKNRRMRVSLKIEEKTKEGETVTLLVDTSPDIRNQLLNVGLEDLTAILYTHGHADHTHGIDDIRSINWLTKHTIPVYADAPTLESLQKRFDYIFSQPPRTSRFICPSIESHLIDGPLDFGPIHTESFWQDHGDSLSRGYRFNDFGYSTDVKNLDETAFDILKGVRVWVVGAIREEPHSKHATLAQVLEWIERLKPERAYLTHMDHSMDYDMLMRRLPKGVEPAYDGLVIEI